MSSRALRVSAPGFGMRAASASIPLAFASATLLRRTSISPLSMNAIVVSLPVRKGRSHAEQAWGFGSAPLPAPLHTRSARPRQCRASIPNRSIMDLASMRRFLHSASVIDPSAFRPIALRQSTSPVLRKRSSIRTAWRGSTSQLPS